TPNEGDPAREVIKLHELRTGCQLILAWYAEDGAPRSASDGHVVTEECVASHLDLGLIDEMGTAVPGDNASLRKALLVLHGRRVGGAALEPNEACPVDRKVS